MRIKDDDGKLLILEAQAYCDCMETSGYGLVLGIVDTDNEARFTRIAEEDVLELVFDLGCEDDVTGSIDGVCFLEYWITGVEVEEECIRIELTDDDGTAECFFTGSKFRALDLWFSAFMIFVTNRLNVTDCILPNQTTQKTEFVLNSN